MAVDAVLLYIGGVTLLFFFWIYGIYAFIRDLKRKFIPLFKQYRRGRRRQKAEAKRNADREEKERELY